MVEFLHSLFFEHKLALLVALQGESIWKGAWGSDTQWMDASKTLVKYEKTPQLAVRRHPRLQVPARVSHARGSKSLYHNSIAMFLTI